MLSAPGSMFNHPLMDKATGTLSNTAHLAGKGKGNVIKKLQSW